MCALADAKTTFPHDYRVLFTGPELPVVVGGQAVNLWAITYLENDQVSGLVTRFGSGDMDIVNSKAVVEFIKTLPDWHYEPTPLKNFGDIRIGAARGVTDDGRKLLVEVLHHVHGLEPQDLVDAEIEYAGTIYRMLDPIALLKAKAANLRDFKQDEDPPRHDAEHLRLIARCLPAYLADVASQDDLSIKAQRNQLKTISRCFALLADKKIASLLREQGIEPSSLIPPTLASSSNEKIRNAYLHQMPLLSRAPGDPA